MAQANARLPHLATWIQHTLALQQARRRVLERIKCAGYKLTDTTAKDITAWARAYLDAHHDECYGRAAEIVERSPVLRKMIEREERRQARKANITTAAQRQRR
jgi:hypothetical protein